MTNVSRLPRQMSWQGQRHRVSVLAEMALRREKVMERLLELRERHGLSQEDAAHKVGITTRQWQRWETGESMPYPRNLDAVASRFGISVADFFDEPADISVDVGQLDRIESKLDEILSLLRDPEVGLVEVLAQAADQRDERGGRPGAKSPRTAAKRRAS